MEKVFEVTFCARQAAWGHAEDFEVSDGRGGADFFDSFLMKSFIGDDAAGGNVLFGKFKLRFDEYEQVGAWF
jgi:hypothetical protein